MSTTSPTIAGSADFSSSDPPPMEEGDYQIGDATTPRGRGMKSIASAIHRWAPALSADDMDRVARWAKIWATDKRPRKRCDEGSGGATFLRELQEAARAGQMAEMGAVAKRRLRLALAAAALAGFLLAIATALFLADAGAVWWMTALVAAVIPLLAADEIGHRAMNAAADRHRRYLLESIRAAESLGELNDAGLFDYLPGSVQSEVRRYDPQRRQHAAAAVIAQLSDALYRDWQGFAGMVEWHVPHDDLNERLGIVPPAKGKGDD